MVHSYVTDDKLVCVYEADSAETILEHAQRWASPPTPSTTSEP